MSWKAQGMKCSYIYYLANPESSSPERQIPADYRPPSPEWISRAGGVAIMKKRKDGKQEDV